MPKKENYTALSDEALQNMSDILKILAHPLRIKLIFILAQNSATVSDLLKILNVRQPNLSQHLTLLKRVKLLKTKREGKSVYYQLSHPEIRDLLESINEITKEIQR
ncbi:MULTISPECIES: ArsR/SmtB family transcription factor [Dictyoglomus]|jgi:ArsR family transcriptional regulator|uniref:Transcriptional regulator, ArsR family n=1 Tax=Dictyoglomus turgidum (strain DSM 6724 / Z-1310) TaxID=515635 RepID=B8E2H0_DICTD|nr:MULTISPECIES: metalloregulator ArsR/SmtB family transcription factor [Dictyoglomus]ACK42814.1 transcriptional regulator, ArsR family [Dictyoglomus turgidum DSM 6724]PNV80979.1 MAG: ArsR family transcriptional regulator [Dictyoglomus turgidum]HBU30873.1 ArsR family transcriptional regulator [Dictyoglomus sp.]